MGADTSLYLIPNIIATVLWYLASSLIAGKSSVQSRYQVKKSGERAKGRDSKLSPLLQGMVETHWAVCDQKNIEMLLLDRPRRVKFLKSVIAKSI